MICGHIRWFQEHFLCPAGPKLCLCCKIILSSCYFFSLLRYAYYPWEKRFWKKMSPPLIPSIFAISPFSLNILFLNFSSAGGGGGRKACRAYRRFMEDGKDLGRRPELVGGGLIRSLGGWSKEISLQLKRCAPPLRAKGGSFGAGQVLHMGCPPPTEGWPARSRPSLLEPGSAPTTYHRTRVATHPYRPTLGRQH